VVVPHLRQQIFKYLPDRRSFCIPAKRENLTSNCASSYHSSSFSAAAILCSPSLLFERVRRNTGSPVLKVIPTHFSAALNERALLAPPGVRATVAAAAAGRRTQIIFIPRPEK
jgi:hypothetical protein